MALQILKCLSDVNVNFEIWVNSKNHIFVKKYSDLGLDLDTIKEIDIYSRGFALRVLPCNIIDLFTFAFKYLTSNKFDNVLYVDGEVFSSGFAPLVTKLFGCVNIIYCPLLPRLKLRNLLFNTILKTFFSISVVINELQLTYWGSFMPGRVLLIQNFINNTDNANNSVEVDELNAKLKDAIGDVLLSNRKNILIPGRIQFSQKKQDELIGLLAASEFLIDNFNFVFVGDGPDFNYLSKIISAKKINSKIKCFLIEWSDCLFADKIFKYWSAVLLNSDYEGEPVVFLKALQKGIPCLAPNNLVSENLVSSKLTFKRRDVDSLVSVLNNILLNEGSLCIIEQKYYIASRRNSSIEGQWIKLLTA